MLELESELHLDRMEIDKRIQELGHAEVEPEFVRQLIDSIPCHWTVVLSRDRGPLLKSPVTVFLVSFGLPHGPKMSLAGHHTLSWNAASIQPDHLFTLYQSAQNKIGLGRLDWPSRQVG
jgi:hypothetical protein